MLRQVADLLQVAREESLLDLVMRLILDTLIALMLLGIVAGVVATDRRDRDVQTRSHRTRLALARLHEQMMLRAALRETPINDAGFACDISPHWFDRDGLPRNSLARAPGHLLHVSGQIHATTVTSDRPWIDLAPPGDTADHPPDPVLISPGQAEFWYNPHRGIIRARVMARESSEATLALYNHVNSSNLRQLPRDNGTRRPVASGAGQASRVSNDDTRRSAEPSFTTRRQ